MRVNKKQFSSMKEFSYEEAQKMLGACALATIQVVSGDKPHPEQGRIWKSLLADFWVKANISDNVVYGSDVPNMLPHVNDKNYFSGH